MAGRAAGAGEERLAGGDVARLRVARRRPFGRLGQVPHVGFQRGAFLGGEVQARRLDLGGLGEAPLVVAGDFEAELDRAGGQDEVVQARRLRLPAEPADPLVFLPADPAGDLGEAGVLDLRRGLQDVVGDRVDEAGAEQGGRVALGVEQGELAGTALGPVDARGRPRTASGS